jgi:hypothetical protein
MAGRFHRCDHRVATRQLEPRQERDAINSGAPHVLEGLLTLDPQEVTVEVDSATALNAEARQWMAQREDGIVHFLTCPNLASSST